jgi:hypothetical protein
VTQVVECLSEHEALGSTPRTTKKRIKKRDNNHLTAWKPK